MEEEVSFTMVSGDDSHVLHIDVTGRDTACIRINNFRGYCQVDFDIDYQQMYELGILLASYALNKQKVDMDFANELLDGFAIPNILLDELLGQ